MPRTRQAALRELVAEGRRLLDAQERSKREQDEKARHLMTTCATILTAGAAATGFFAGRLAGALLAPAVVLLAVGLACMGRAFLLFSAAYTGQRLRPNDLAIGWDPVALRAAARLPLKADDILQGTVEKLPSWVGQNQEALDRAAGQQRTGSRLLFWGSGILVASLIYGMAANGWVR
ncbi:MAG: hypothetical protein LC620_00860 [Halobacteriales archaeon]|nr:hypothetical protein [Halobacteriales archaeon]